jgi:mRNA interferase RelE/StbE
MYQVDFASAGKREFVRLSKILPEKAVLRIATAITALSDNPRPEGARKLAGSESIYRVRGGDFRILYYIDDKVRSVVILRIRRRSEDTYDNIV